MGHPEIHWPAGFTPEHAHSFCNAHAFVQAPPDRVFSLLADVTWWPQWVPGVTEVVPGAPPKTFQLLFHGHRFEVFAGEQDRPHRLGWSAVGAGVQLYQAWLLSEVEHGTHVITENVVRGPAAHSMNMSSPPWTVRLNSLWLAQLKRMSENFQKPV
ncbi:SRPBCC family protein [Streptomyces sp. NPDC097727]|uniref:SRPBCC family protein n=1 Tax=Streptomyces sp. NPDC097727 TaxID=3366092 RepID=UPI0038047C76